MFEHQYKVKIQDSFETKFVSKTNLSDQTVEDIATKVIQDEIDKMRLRTRMRIQSAINGYEAGIQFEKNIALKEAGSQISKTVYTMVLMNRLKKYDAVFNEKPIKLHKSFESLMNDLNTSSN